MMYGIFPLHTLAQGGTQDSKNFMESNFFFLKVWLASPPVLLLQTASPQKNPKLWKSTYFLLRSRILRVLSFRLDFLLLCHIWLFFWCGYVIFPEKSEWQITLACKWFTHHLARYKKKKKEIKKRKKREIGWVKIITYYQVTNVQLGVPCG